MTNSKHQKMGIFARKFAAIIVIACMFYQTSFAEAGAQDLAQKIQQPAIKIPTVLGRVDLSFPGTNGKTVVYIQDAHDSLEAQQNIARIIQHLVEHKKVKTVFEEGYEGRVPTDDYFGWIQDSKIREKVAFDYLDQLQIGGAEYAHINRRSRLMDQRPATNDQRQTSDYRPPTNDYRLKTNGQKLDPRVREDDGFVSNHKSRITNHAHDWQLIGVDSFKLQLENVRAYADQARVQNQIAQELGWIKKQLKPLISKRFSKRAMEWLRLRVRFEEQKIDLGNYLLRLHKQGEDFLGFPGLALLLKAQIYPHAKLKPLLEEIDPQTLLREVDQLQQSLGWWLVTSDDDRTLLEMFDAVRLLERLNAMKLSYGEYEIIKSRIADFKTQKFADQISRLSGKSIVFSRGWEKRIQSAIRFYEIAHERDAVIEKIFENPAEGLHSVQRTEYTPHPTSPRAGRGERGTLYDLPFTDKNRTAILVYGGFHREAILSSLKRLGYGVAVVTPKISEVSPRHQKIYQREMTADISNLQLPATASRFIAVLERAALSPSEAKSFRAEIRSKFELLGGRAESRMGHDPLDEKIKKIRTELVEWGYAGGRYPKAQWREMSDKDFFLEAEKVLWKMIRGRKKLNRGILKKNYALSQILNSADQSVLSEIYRRSSISLFNYQSRERYRNWGSTLAAIKKIAPERRLIAGEANIDYFLLSLLMRMLGIYYNGVALQRAQTLLDAIQDPGQGSSGHRFFRSAELLLHQAHGDFGEGTEIIYEKFVGDLDSGKIPNSNKLEIARLGAILLTRHLLGGDGETDNIDYKLLLHYMIILFKEYERSRKSKLPMSARQQIIEALMGPLLIQNSPLLLPRSRRWKRIQSVLEVPLAKTQAEYFRLLEANRASLAKDIEALNYANLSYNPYAFRVSGDFGPLYIWRELAREMNGHATPLPYYDDFLTAWSGKDPHALARPFLQLTDDKVRIRKKIQHLISYLSRPEMRRTIAKKQDFWEGWWKRLGKYLRDSEMGDVRNLLQELAAVGERLGGKGSKAVERIRKRIKPADATGPAQFRPSYGSSLVWFPSQEGTAQDLLKPFEEIQLRLKQIFGEEFLSIQPNDLHLTVRNLSRELEKAVKISELTEKAATARQFIASKPHAKGMLVGPFWHREFGFVMIWKPQRQDPLQWIKRDAESVFQLEPQDRLLHLTLGYHTQAAPTAEKLTAYYSRLNGFPAYHIPVNISHMQVAGYSDIGYTDSNRPVAAGIELGTAQETTGEEREVALQAGDAEALRQIALDFKKISDQLRSLERLTDGIKAFVSGEKEPGEINFLDWFEMHDFRNTLGGFQSAVRNGESKAILQSGNELFFNVESFLLHASEMNATSLKGYVTAKLFADGAGLTADKPIPYETLGVFFPLQMYLQGSSKWDEFENKMKQLETSWLQIKPPLRAVLNRIHALARPEMRRTERENKNRAEGRFEGAEEYLPSDYLKKRRGKMPARIYLKVKNPKSGSEHLVLLQFPVMDDIEIYGDDHIFYRCFVLPVPSQEIPTDANDLAAFKNSIYQSHEKIDNGSFLILRENDTRVIYRTHLTGAYHSYPWLDLLIQQWFGRSHNVRHHPPEEQKEFHSLSDRVTYAPPAAAIDEESGRMIGFFWIYEKKLQGGKVEHYVVHLEMAPHHSKIYDVYVRKIESSSPDLAVWNLLNKDGVRGMQFDYAGRVDLKFSEDGLLISGEPFLREMPLAGELEEFIKVRLGELQGKPFDERTKNLSINPAYKPARLNIEWAGEERWSVFDDYTHQFWLGTQGDLAAAGQLRKERPAFIYEGDRLVGWDEATKKLAQLLPQYAETSALLYAGDNERQASLIFSFKPAVDSADIQLTFAVSPRHYARKIVSHRAANQAHAVAAFADDAHMLHELNSDEEGYLRALVSFDNKGLPMGFEIYPDRKMKDPKLIRYDLIYAAKLIVSILKEMGLTDEQVAQLQNGVVGGWRQAAADSEKETVAGSDVDYTGQQLLAISKLDPKVEISSQPRLKNRQEDFPGFTAKQAQLLDLAQRLWPQTNPVIDFISINEKKLLNVRTGFYWILGDFMFVDESWFHKVGVTLGNADRELMIALDFDEPKRTGLLDFHYVPHTAVAIILMQAYSERIVGKTIFDAGTGNGILAMLASRMGAEKVYSVDRDEDSLVWAEQLIELNRIKNVELIQADFAVAPEKSFADEIETVIANIGYNGKSPTGNWHISFSSMPHVQHYFIPGLETYERVDRTQLPLLQEYFQHPNWVTVDHRVIQSSESAYISYVFDRASDGSHFDREKVRPEMRMIVKGDASFNGYRRFFQDIHPRAQQALVAERVVIPGVRRDVFRFPAMPVTGDNLERYREERKGPSPFFMRGSLSPILEVEERDVAFVEFNPEQNVSLVSFDYHHCWAVSIRAIAGERQILGLAHLVPFRGHDDMKDQLRAIADYLKSKITKGEWSDVQIQISVREDFSGFPEMREPQDAEVLFKHPGIRVMPTYVKSKQNVPWLNVWVQKDRISAEQNKVYDEHQGLPPLDYNVEKTETFYLEWDWLSINFIPASGSVNSGHYEVTRAEARQEPVTSNAHFVKDKAVSAGTALSAGERGTHDAVLPKSRPEMRGEPKAVAGALGAPGAEVVVDNRFGFATHRTNTKLKNKSHRAEARRTPASEPTTLRRQLDQVLTREDILHNWILIHPVNAQALKSIEELPEFLKPIARSLLAKYKTWEQICENAEAAYQRQLEPVRKDQDQMARLTQRVLEFQSKSSQRWGWNTRFVPNPQKESVPAKTIKPGNTRRARTKITPDKKTPQNQEKLFMYWDANARLAADTGNTEAEIERKLALLSSDLRQMIELRYGHYASAITSHREIAQRLNENRKGSAPLYNQHTVRFKLSYALALLETSMVHAAKQKRPEMRFLHAVILNLFFRRGKTSKNPTIPIREFSEHDGLYHWIKEKFAGQEEMLRSAALLHVDYHPDNNTKHMNKVAPYNVLTHIASEKMVGSIHWVGGEALNPDGVKMMGEKDSATLTSVNLFGESLPVLTGPVIISLDYDTFASREEWQNPLLQQLGDSPPKRGHIAPSLEEALARIDQFFSKLKTAQYDIRGIFLARSPNYTYFDYAPEIRKRIFQHLKQMFPKVKIEKDETFWLSFKKEIEPLLSHFALIPVGVFATSINLYANGGLLFRERIFKLLGFSNPLFAMFSMTQKAPLRMDQLYNLFTAGYPADWGALLFHLVRARMKHLTGKDVGKEFNFLPEDFPTHAEYLAAVRSNILKPLLDFISHRAEMRDPIEVRLSDLYGEDIYAEEIDFNNAAEIKKAVRGLKEKDGIKLFQLKGVEKHQLTNALDEGADLAESLGRLGHELESSGRAKFNLPQSTFMPRLNDFSNLIADALADKVKERKVRWDAALKFDSAKDYLRSRLLTFLKLAIAEAHEFDLSKDLYLLLRTDGNGDLKVSVIDTASEHSGRAPPREVLGVIGFDFPAYKAGRHSSLGPVIEFDNEDFYVTELRQRPFRPRVVIGHEISFYLQFINKWDVFFEKADQEKISRESDEQRIKNNPFDESLWQKFVAQPWREWVMAKPDDPISKMTHFKEAEKISGQAALFVKLALEQLPQTAIDDAAEAVETFADQNSEKRKRVEAMRDWLVAALQESATTYFNHALFKALILLRNDESDSVTPELYNRLVQYLLTSIPSYSESLVNSELWADGKTWVHRNYLGYLASESKPETSEETIDRHEEWLETADEAREEGIDLNGIRHTWISSPREPVQSVETLPGFPDIQFRLERYGMDEVKASDQVKDFDEAKGLLVEGFVEGALIASHGIKNIMIPLWVTHQDENIEFQLHGHTWRLIGLVRDGGRAFYEDTETHLIVSVGLNVRPNPANDLYEELMRRIQEFIATHQEGAEQNELMQKFRPFTRAEKTYEGPMQFEVTQATLLQMYAWAKEIRGRDLTEAERKEITVFMRVFETPHPDQGWFDVALIRRLLKILKIKPGASTQKKNGGPWPEPEEIEPAEVMRVQNDQFVFAPNIERALELSAQEIRERRAPSARLTLETSRQLIHEELERIHARERPEMRGVKNTDQTRLQKKFPNPSFLGLSLIEQAIYLIIAGALAGVFFIAAILRFSGFWTLSGNIVAMASDLFSFLRRNLKSSHLETEGAVRKDRSEIREKTDHRLPTDGNGQKLGSRFSVPGPKLGRLEMRNFQKESILIGSNEGLDRLIALAREHRFIYAHGLAGSGKSTWLQLASEGVQAKTAYFRANFTSVERGLKELAKQFDLIWNEADGSAKLAEALKAKIGDKPLVIDSPWEFLQHERQAKQGWYFLQALRRAGVAVIFVNRTKFGYLDRLDWIGREIYDASIPRVILGLPDERAYREIAESSTKFFILEKWLKHDANYDLDGIRQTFLEKIKILFEYTGGNKYLTQAFFWMLLEDVLKIYKKIRPTREQASAAVAAWSERVQDPGSLVAWAREYMVSRNSYGSLDNLSGDLFENVRFASPLVQVFLKFQNPVLIEEIRRWDDEEQAVVQQFVDLGILISEGDRIRYSQKSFSERRWQNLEEYIRRQTGGRPEMRDTVLSNRNIHSEAVLRHREDAQIYSKYTYKDSRRAQRFFNKRFGKSANRILKFIFESNRVNLADIDKIERTKFKHAEMEYAWLDSERNPTAYLQHRTRYRIYLKGHDRPKIFYFKWNELRFASIGQKEASDQIETNWFLREHAITQQAFKKGLAPNSMLIPNRNGLAIVVKEVRGKPLDEFTDKELTEDVLKAIGRALGQLHRAGIIHEDVSLTRPHHIHVEYTKKGPKVYFIDFGISSRSKSNSKRKTEFKNLEQAVGGYISSDKKMKIVSFRNGYKEGLASRRSEMRPKTFDEWASLEEMVDFLMRAMPESLLSRQQVAERLQDLDKDPIKTATDPKSFLRKSSFYKQGPLLEEIFKRWIRKNVLKKKVVIYQAGLGKYPHETFSILSFFIKALRAEKQNVSDWKIYLLGVDGRSRIVETHASIVAQLIEEARNRKKKWIEVERQQRAQLDAHQEDGVALGYYPHFSKNLWRQLRPVFNSSPQNQTIQTGFAESNFFSKGGLERVQADFEARFRQSLPADFIFERHVSYLSQATSWPNAFLESQSLLIAPLAGYLIIRNLLGRLGGEQEVYYIQEPNVFFVDYGPKYVKQSQMKPPVFLVKSSRLVTWRDIFPGSLSRSYPDEAVQNRGTGIQLVSDPRAVLDMAFSDFLSGAGIVRHRAEMRPDFQANQHVHLNGNEKLDHGQRKLLKKWLQVLVELSAAREKYEPGSHVAVAVSKKQLLEESGIEALFFNCSFDVPSFKAAVWLIRQLKKKNPQMKIVVSGSDGNHDGVVENYRDADGNPLKPAVYAAQLFRKNGIDVPDDFIEPDATNTEQNVVFSAKLLSDKKIYPKKILIIQNPYGQKRGSATFLKRYPGGTDNVTLISYAPYLPDFKHMRDSELIRWAQVLVGEEERYRKYPYLPYEYIVPFEVPKRVSVVAQHVRALLKKIHAENGIPAIKNGKKRNRSEMRGEPTTAIRPLTTAFEKSFGSPIIGSQLSVVGSRSVRSEMRKLKQPFQFFGRETGTAQNRPERSGLNRFGSMDGDNRSARKIGGMSQYRMATALPEGHETGFVQSANQPRAGDLREIGHGELSRNFFDRYFPLLKRLLVLLQRPQVKFDRFFNVRNRFASGFTLRGAAGQLWNINAVSALFFFFQDNFVFHISKLLLNGANYSMSWPGLKTSIKEPVTSDVYFVGDRATSAVHPKKRREMRTAIESRELTFDEQDIFSAFKKVGWEISEKQILSDRAAYADVAISSVEAKQDRRVKLLYWKDKPFAVYWPDELLKQHQLALLLDPASVDIINHFFENFLYEHFDILLEDRWDWKVHAHPLKKIELSRRIMAPESIDDEGWIYSYGDVFNAESYEAGRFAELTAQHAGVNAQTAYDLGMGTGVQSISMAEKRNLSHLVAVDHNLFALIAGAINFHRRGPPETKFEILFADLLHQEAWQALLDRFGRRDLVLAHLPVPDLDTETVPNGSPRRANHYDSSGKIQSAISRFAEKLISEHGQFFTLSDRELSYAVNSRRVSVRILERHSIAPYYYYLISPRTEMRNEREEGKRYSRIFNSVVQLLQKKHIEELHAWQMETVRHVKADEKAGQKQPAGKKPRLFDPVSIVLGHLGVDGAFFKRKKEVIDFLASFAGDQEVLKRIFSILFSIVRKSYHEPHNASKVDGAKVILLELYEKLIASGKPETGRFLKAFVVTRVEDLFNRFARAGRGKDSLKKPFKEEMKYMKNFMTADEIAGIWENYKAVLEFRYPPLPPPEVIQNLIFNTPVVDPRKIGVPPVSAAKPSSSPRTEMRIEFDEIPLPEPARFWGLDLDLLRAITKKGGRHFESESFASFLLTHALPNLRNPNQLIQLRWDIEKSSNVIVLHDRLTGAEEVLPKSAIVFTERGDTVEVVRLTIDRHFLETGKGVGSTILAYLAAYAVLRQKNIQIGSSGSYNLMRALFRFVGYRWFDDRGNSVISKFTKPHDMQVVFSFAETESERVVFTFGDRKFEAVNARGAIGANAWKGMKLALDDRSTLRVVGLPTPRPHGIYWDLMAFHEIKIAPQDMHFYVQLRDEAMPARAAVTKPGLGGNKVGVVYAGKIPAHSEMREQTRPAANAQRPTSDHQPSAFSVQRSANNIRPEMRRLNRWLIQMAALGVGIGALVLVRKLALLGDYQALIEFYGMKITTLTLIQAPIFTAGYLVMMSVAKYFYDLKVKGKATIKPSIRFALNIWIFLAFPFFFYKPLILTGVDHLTTSLILGSAVKLFLDSFLALLHQFIFNYVNFVRPQKSRGENGFIWKQFLLNWGDAVLWWAGPNLIGFNLLLLFPTTGIYLLPMLMAIANYYIWPRLMARAHARAPRFASDSVKKNETGRNEMRYAAGHSWFDEGIPTLIDTLPGLYTAELLKDQLEKKPDSVLLMPSGQSANAFYISFSGKVFNDGIDLSRATFLFVPETVSSGEKPLLGVGLKYLPINNRPHILSVYGGTEAEPVLTNEDFVDDLPVGVERIDAAFFIFGKNEKVFEYPAEIGGLITHDLIDQYMLWPEDRDGLSDAHSEGIPLRWIFKRFGNKQDKVVMVISQRQLNAFKRERKKLKEAEQSQELAARKKRKTQTAFDNRREMREQTKKANQRPEVRSKKPVTGNASSLKGRAASAVPALTAGGHKSQKVFLDGSQDYDVNEFAALLLTREDLKVVVYNSKGSSFAAKLKTFDFSNLRVEFRAQSFEEARKPDEGRNVQMIHYASESFAGAASLKKVVFVRGQAGALAYALKHWADIELSRVDGVTRQNNELWIPDFIAKSALSSILMNFAFSRAA